MKQIRITNVSLTKDIYEVWLGNGTVHAFKNLKAANKFLVETSKFLTNCLFTCNDSLNELHTQARELWLLSDDPHTDRTVKSELENLSHFLSLSVSRAGWKNGNFYAFIDLQKFCFTGKRLVKTLQNIGTVKSTDTLRRYRLDAIFQKLHAEENKILNFGQLEAVKLFDATKYHLQDEHSETMQASA